MIISARNQIDGTIKEIKHGIVSTLLVLVTSKGTKLYANITETSTEDMKLQLGDKVIAFFKASHVLIAKGKTIPISARNKLQGVIDSISLGAVNSEIVIKIESGDFLRAIITNDAVKDMALQDGDQIIAIIKSSDMMIGK